MNVLSPYNNSLGVNFIKKQTTIFSTLLIICLVSFASAQNYESFFGANETHMVRLTNNNTFGQFPLGIDSLAITSEVITENNLTLKQVDLFEYLHDGVVSTFYLREDLLEGKLWGRETIEAEETLIIDLSLEVGDNTSIFGNNANFTVSEVSYQNGLKYIKFDPPIYPYLGIPGNEQIHLFFREGVINFFEHTSFFLTHITLQQLYVLKKMETKCITLHRIGTFPQKHG